MSTIEVEPLSMPRDAVRFAKTWWPIYRDDPLWVPPLLFERKQFFDPAKNPYHRVASVQCFLATRNGEPAGTITATVDEKYQDEDPGMGFFGFFEFVDDESVARALFEAAGSWLRERGMNRMMGPFNLNTNHEFGLLVDGFDTPPCVANPHHRPYYGPMYEKLGLERNMDWYAYWLDGDTPVSPLVRQVSDRLLKRHPEIRLRNMDLKRWDREVLILRDIYNDAWTHNWAHVQLTPAEFRYLADGFKQLVDPTLCFFAEVDGVPAALSVTFPDYNQVVRKMNGRLFPFGWCHFVFGRKRIDSARTFMLGVKHEFQHLALGAPLYIATWERCLEMGLRGGEASLILHENHRMRGALEKLGTRIYKTYRTYEIEL